MNHIGKWHPFFFFIYKDGCPPCKVRQIRYCRHFGNEREVKKALRDDVLNNKLFSKYQANWILWQCCLREIE